MEHFAIIRMCVSVTVPYNIYLHYSNKILQHPQEITGRRPLGQNLNSVRIAYIAKYGIRCPYQELGLGPLNYVRNYIPLGEEECFLEPP